MMRGPGCLLLCGLLAVAAAGRPVINQGSIQPVVYVDRNTSAPEVITCEASSESNDVLFAWYFENTPISVPRHTSLSVSNNTLAFMAGAPFTLSGWYTCVASNDFGTDFRDFLVVIGERPSLELFLRSGESYAVLPMSRVELPCLLAAGVPHPDIQWFSDSDEITNGGDFTIDPVTGSLTIRRFSSNDVPLTGFSCQAGNRFGVVQTEPVLISLSTAPLPEPMIRTLLNSMELTESSEVANLMCTDLPLMLIQAENFTFEWTRNQEAITATSGDMNSLAVMAGSSAMGYYCCRVSQNGTLLSTFCTTVYQTFDPQFVDSTQRDVSIGPMRGANLVCQTATPNLLNLPSLAWLDGNGESVASGKDVEVSMENAGFSYLIYTGDKRRNYTCVDVDNPSFQRSFQIKVTDTCRSVDGVDVIRNGNGASLMDWTASGDASTATVANEAVFRLNYSDEGPFALLKQLMPVEEGAGTIRISGRMRQTEETSVGTSVQAVIQVLLDSQVIGELRNDYPERDAWQEEARNFTFQSIKGSAISVYLTLRLVPMGQRTNEGRTVVGSAFFDDICATIALDPANTSAVDLAVVVGASVGGVCVLLVLLVCLMALYCCCLRSKEKAKMMRKMSTVIGKKFGGDKRYVTSPEAVAGGAHEVYSTADDSGSTLKRAAEDEQLYETVDEMQDRVQPEDSLYINPENYQQVETALGGGGGEEGGGEEGGGHYTSIDRDKMDSTKVYMATNQPASPDSSGADSEYMQVLAGSHDNSNGTTKS